MANNDYEKMYHPVREMSSLKDLVVGNGELFGDNTAFLVKDVKGGEYREINYRTFKEDVDAVGTRLMNLGLDGERIAVIGENCYDWVVAYFAVVNSTNVVVPLDKELSPEEIYMLIKTAGCKAVFYTSSYKNVFEKYDIQYKFEMEMYSEKRNLENQNQMSNIIKQGKALLESGDRGFLDVIIDTEEMKIMLFTSGTTGVPKAVMLCHRNLIRNILDTAKIVMVTEEDRSLSILPIHHTFESTIGIMGMMNRGGSIAFFEGLKYIGKNIVEAKCTIVIGVPLIVESVYDKIWKGARKQNKEKALKFAIKLNKTLMAVGIDARSKLFKSVYENLGGRLRLILCGAASMDPKVARGLQDLGIEVAQGYGLTETSPLLTGTPDFTDRYSKAGSVGPALPEGKIKIENQNDEGIGEIVYKGPNVMLGYYNMPEETAEVVKDGWLYTGDLGFLDDNGWLYITGRKKNVIVTKTGKNIYPEELEVVLSKLKYIDECMVFGMDSEDGLDTIVSVQIRPNYEAIYKEHGDDFDNEQIYYLLKKNIAEINQAMPNYKHIRQVIIRKTEFVKTTTQKIKRQDNLDLLEENVVRIKK